MSTPRVLFDASTLFGKENRRKITRLADRDRPAITPLWTEWVIGELYYSMAWSWAASIVRQGKQLTDADRRWMGRSAKDMLGHMLRTFQVISLHGQDLQAPIPFLPDPDDRHLHLGATMGRADIAVMEDRAVLSTASSWRPIRLLAADAFFQEFDPDTVEDPEPDEA